MELKELKVIFDNGGLKSVTIKRAPLMQGFILIAVNGNKEAHVMTSQREGPMYQGHSKRLMQRCLMRKRLVFRKLL
ncbi:putative uncharacterized protein [Moritella viscosa]|uniref:plasmid replication protein RepB n=1 Tax=Moritella viscosa TaxID=80854 RepID=UPI0005090542|nr:plasmid replication protein RepB [Moritella viscosa]CED60180.1 putative uncharacterized protein [Moritella viscosa]